MKRWEADGFTSWFTIETVAGLVADTESNIQGFIREDRIPYMVFSDGILIWWSGFQNCMPDLYDLVGDLERLHEAAKEIDPADLQRVLKEDRDNRV